MIFTDFRTGRQDLLHYPLHPVTKHERLSYVLTVLGYTMFEIPKDLFFHVKAQIYRKISPARRTATPDAEKISRKCSTFSSIFEWYPGNQTIMKDAGNRNRGQKMSIWINPRTNKLKNMGNKNTLTSKSTEADREKILDLSDAINVFFKKLCGGIIIVEGQLNKF